MLQKTGERQIGVSLNEVREDHKARYQWVSSQLSENDRVLDAGCGIGYGSMILSEQVQSVYAVDVSNETIDYAKKYWARPNVRYDVQDLHFCDFPAELKFSAIVAFEVMEHLLEPRLFLESAKKFLGENGHLFLSFPNELVTPHTIELNPFHIRHYTPEEAKALLLESGYEVDGVFSQSSKEVVSGTTGKFLVFSTYPRKPSVSGKQMECLRKIALTEGGAQLVARSLVLEKVKKEVKSLKSRLDEARKMIAISVGDSPPGEFSEIIKILEQRIRSVEATLLSDLSQRNSVLESSEKLAKENLYKAQQKVVQLEREKQVFLAELKRNQEIFDRQVREISKLEKECLDLNCKLNENQNSFTQLENNFVNQKSQIDRINLQLETQEKQLEKERLAAQNKKERLAEECRRLRSEIEVVKNDKKEIEVICQKLKDSQRVQILKMADFEKALASEEKTQVLLTKEVNAAQTELTATENELSIKKKELGKAESNFKQLSVKLLAIASENEVLRKTNETLSLELENSKFNEATSLVANNFSPKGPPSFGYMWRKLKYHNFYGPFVGRAIRNSFGLKRARRKKTS